MSYPCLKYDANMPKLNLVYDHWTVLQEPDTAGVPQHGRVPWNAEIDVHMRRARIPEVWALILQPCQFQLEVANANRPAIEVVLAWGGGMWHEYPVLHDCRLLVVYIQIRHKTRALWNDHGYRQLAGAGRSGHVPGCALLEGSCVVRQGPSSGASAFM